jgi:hypothetical protein
MHPLLAALAALTLAAACTQLPPNLDGAESAEARMAPYPTLIPLETLTESASAAADDPTAAVEARAARLRARAAALRRDGAG